MTGFYARPIKIRPKNPDDWDRVSFLTRQKRQIPQSDHRAKPPRGGLKKPSPGGIKKLSLSLLFGTKILADHP